MENITDRIQLFTQSSIKLQGEEFIVYIDPFQMKEEFHDADFIIFTHSHYDHFSIEDIEKVKKSETLFVAPRSMEEELNKAGIPKDKSYLVTPDSVKRVKGLEIKAVPAYNKLKPFHPKKNGWVGYVLTMDGIEIYIAGDTDNLKENHDIICDIALIPIGGKFTMNYQEAADFVNAMRPGIVIPTHYGTIVGKESDAREFAKLVDAGIRVEIKKQY